MDVPQEEVDYQMARAEEFSMKGLSAFIIAGMSIITFAVVLRLWSRRVAKIEWKSDDYTLIVALLLTIGAQIAQLFMIHHGGFGRHTLTVDDDTWAWYGRSCYAWDILYTIGYPIARISLVLLYRRVFIQQWFRATCWFLIACYAGYALSTAIAGFCQALPVAGNWDRSIKNVKHIDDQKLYLANAGFNITTDAILLVMPLIVIWSLSFKPSHKIGLSFIFSLGVLTVLASILRLVYYYRRLTPMDPLFTLDKADWWTIVEMDLGILCPCLVTLGPLIKAGYIVFSSHLSPRTRERLDRMSGVSRAVAGTINSKFGAGHKRGNGSSSDSQLEAQSYDLDDISKPEPVAKKDGQAGPRDDKGMAVNQDAALANLDPRVRARDDGKGQTRRMGTSTEAVADQPTSNAPGEGIGVSRDYRLESERGSGST